MVVCACRLQFYASIARHRCMVFLALVFSRGSDNPPPWRDWVVDGQRVLAWRSMNEASSNAIGRTLLCRRHLSIRDVRNDVP